MRGLNPVDHLITGPTKEPLDLNEVRKALIAVSEVDETLVDGFISAARQRFEAQTGRQVITATWELWLDAFPCGQFELPKAPLQRVTSVTYTDPAGDAQVLATDAYTVHAPVGVEAGRGWIAPAYGRTWPSTRDESGAVRIRYVAGYGHTYASVPELLRAALYLLVTDFFCSRCAADDKPAPKKPIGMDELIGAFVLRNTRTAEGWD